ncbi:MAG TPA: hypothetical protein VFS30_14440 [Dehalococcoidia bacterium]|nr:hypothetical protein [Dehalococcoidia bacterium]
MNYAHLYTGDDGLSYFRDVEVPMTDRGEGTELSGLFAAKGMLMRRNTADYQLDYHPAPRRQFIFNLTGTVEIVASGGETRQFGPGSIMLADDTTGKGHISKALTAERVSIFVHVDEV